jgi:dTDP-4-amino-4,6-dideoxygalactose transaminase
VTLRERLARHPPAVSRIPFDSLWRSLRHPDPEAELRSELARRLGARRVELFRSGREALRTALVAAARATGRGEVLLPAYTCFSVPAACVAAGLRVRLVDLDERGRLVPDSVHERDWRTAAAWLADNLFGLPSPLEPFAARAAAAGAWRIDDAAQAFGAGTPAGPVGSRADVGLLSFGRGKPLSGLGGGALAWGSVPLEVGEQPAARAPVRALARWLVYALAARRPVFGLLASIPALGIGETPYDPDFERGGIEGPAATLALAALADCAAAASERRSRAHRIAARMAELGSDFEPLLEGNGCSGVFPRLAVLAPDAKRRDAALERLRVWGATAMYPQPLGAIERLAPHLVGDSRCPGAARFCARLLTLPTHDGVSDASIERMARALR